MDSGEVKQMMIEPLSAAFRDAVSALIVVAVSRADIPKQQPKTRNA
jgi:hypothetical protein